MLVAVTGSSGLIGTALVAALQRDGHDVRRVVRRGPAEPAAIRWDVEAGTIDAAGLEGVDSVVHLAGAGIGDKRWTPERKRVVRESRTKGTDLLARTLAGLSAKPAVLLSASGINYYGDGGDAVRVEHDHRGSGFLAELVEDWEAATAPARDAGIRTAHLRSGMVLSGKGGALGPLLPLFRFGVGGRIGSGRQWWSWIALHDHVRATRWLLEHDVTGPVNLTSPNPVTNADFTRTLASVLRRPALLPVPPLAPSILLGRELVDELLLASMRVVPSVLLDHGFTFDHPTLDGALRAELGRTAG